MSLRYSCVHGVVLAGLRRVGRGDAAGVGHHDDHRLGLPGRDEVVEDELGVAALAGVGARPLRVVVAAAVVQVEHGILGVGIRLVARRQVDVHPLLFPGVVRVGRLLDLAVGDVGLGVERGVVEGGQGRQDGQRGRPRLRHRRHAAGPRPPGRPGGPPRPSSFGAWPWPAPGGLGSDFGSWAEAAGDPAEASPSTAIERSRRDASMVPDSGRGIGTAPYYQGGRRGGHLQPELSVELIPTLRQGTRGGDGDR